MTRACVQPPGPTRRLSHVGAVTHRNRLADLARALAAGDGVAHAADLVAASSRGTLRRAVADGVVVAVGGGVYADPEVMRARVVGTAGGRSWARWDEEPPRGHLLSLRRDAAIAGGLDAALALRSAARRHDWPILREPERVEVAVPAFRHVRHDRTALATIHRRDLSDDERRDGVTSPLRTVLDCAAALPLREALAVADSALRAGDVGPIELREAADVYRGRNVAQVRSVARMANALAENPFESALRAVLTGVEELSLDLQFTPPGGGSMRFDLADVGRGIAFEADGYEFHGTRSDFLKGCRRTLGSMTRGWIIAPCTFDMATGDVEWLRDCAREIAGWRPPDFMNHLGRVDPDRSRTTTR